MNDVKTTLSFQNIRNRELQKGLLFFGTLLYVFASAIEGFTSAGLILEAAGIFVIVLVWLLRQPVSGTRLVITGFSIYIAVFGLYCTVTMFWAEVPEYSFHYAREIFLLLIVMTILLSCLYRENKVDFILKIIMYSGYVIVLYVFMRYLMHGGLSVIIGMTAGKRMNNDYVNANVLAMAAAYSIVINFYYIIKRRLRPVDLLILPSVLMIAASGSRKGILILAAGVIMLFVSNSYDPRNRGYSIFKIIIILAALALLIGLLLQLPVFDTIRQRMEQLVSIYTAGKDSVHRSESIRATYNEIGIGLFREHPVFGIGIANARLYIEQFYQHIHLHNNVIELLACGGIVGFSIYYSIYVYLAVKLVKLRKYRDSEFDICVIFFIITLVMGYGYIQYYGLKTYLYLMMFWLKVKQLERKGKNDERTVKAC